MESGEWWLDESGYTTFADGDVGDQNHEMIAFQAALGLDGDVYDDLDWLIPGERLSVPQQKELLRLGVKKAVVDYFKGGADARDYALEFMGWIRVKGTNFETWTLTDAAMANIQGADFWEEFDGDSDEFVFVEERSTGQTWNAPMKVLLNQKTAAGFKAFMAGSGAYRGFGWVCRKGKCRRARGAGRRL